MLVFMDFWLCPVASCVSRERKRTRGMLSTAEKLSPIPPHVHFQEVPECSRQWRWSNEGSFRTSGILHSNMPCHKVNEVWLILALSHLLSASAPILSTLVQPAAHSVRKAGVVITAVLQADLGWTHEPAAYVKITHCPPELSLGGVVVHLPPIAPSLTSRVVQINGSAARAW